MRRLAALLCVAASLNPLAVGALRLGSPCVRCSRARPATLPPVLVLHLKRFEFDFDTMRKYKVYDMVQFPFGSELLDMTPYTKAELLRKDEQQGDGSACAVPQEPLLYRLVGVLVHTGTADSGHYYSHIADRFSASGGEQQRWFTFNDGDVSPFDPEDIPMCAFGGMDTVVDPHDKQLRHMPRPHSGYLLFYERVPAATATAAAVATALEPTLSCCSGGGASRRPTLCADGGGLRRSAGSS